MNLEPFYTLLFTQTLFIHSKQETGFANSFQVKFVSIPGRDNKLLVQLGIDWHHLILTTVLFDTSNSLHGKFKRITYHFLDWISAG